MSTTQTITLTARQFRALVDPVLPLAEKDGFHPALNSLHVFTDGKWLLAEGTDRFRLGIKRIEKVVTDDDTTTEWPAFDAVIPLRAIHSILSTFKPLRGFDPTMTLVRENDDLAVEAAGSFSIFDQARFVHHLCTEDYPSVRKVFSSALALRDSDRSVRLSFNPAFLADFKHTGAYALRIIAGAPGKPTIVTDDDGFLGAIMPRKTDRPEEDWSDVLPPAESPAAVA